LDPLRLAIAQAGSPRAARLKRRRIYRRNISQTFIGVNNYIYM
jgi:hypothetical protein